MKGYELRIGKGFMTGSLIVAGMIPFRYDALASESENKPPSVAASVPQSVQRQRYVGVHSQIRNLATPIADRYPRADSIGLAVVIVPDPLVPRYRRLYDLSIAALELGMMKDGYVLDRFSFPWDEELRRSGASASSEGKEKPKNEEGDDVEATGLNSGSYGLIVFRCDTWRGDACVHPQPGDVPPANSGSTHVRALYVVTETATAGVARHQLRCALRKIESQTGEVTLPADASCPAGPGNDRRGNTKALEYPGSECRGGADGGPGIVALGPNFSGSMDSVGAGVDEMLTQQNRKLCLIASSATDLTNRHVAKPFPSIVYRTTALEDDIKLWHIAQLADRLGADFHANPITDVAILAEASTFGYGVCQRAGAADPRAVGSPPGAKELVSQFCRSPKFFFPPTLADIRFGLQKQQADQISELADAARHIENDRHLPLEVAAENGSEFPESQQSAVTAAGNQLQLDRVFASLVESGPKMVVVAATDVRDRLFLFDLLRGKLPQAMLIDLEADSLITHPEFLYATRGALAVASANLTSRGSLLACNPGATDEVSAAWSTDGQGLLADNVARLREPDSPGAPARASCALSDSPEAAERQAALQVVTFNGLTPVSYAFPKHEAGGDRGEKFQRPRFNLLPTAECFALLFCLTLPFLWLWPARIPDTKGDNQLHLSQELKLERRYLTIVGIGCVPIILLAPFVAYYSSSQSGAPLTYWIVTIEIIGVVALWRCYAQIRHTLWSANHRYYAGSSLALSLAVIALMFAMTPFLVAVQAIPPPFIDDGLLKALGFDPYSGLSFYLMVALTVLIVLYTSALVATRTWVVRRNFHLMAEAFKRVNRSTPFVIKRDPNETAESRMNAPHSYRPLPVWTFVWIAVLVILALALPGLWDDLGGPRLTVFGPRAARVAVLALSANTLCASILVFGIYGAGRRITMLSGYVRSRALERVPPLKPRDTGEILDPWEGGAEMPFAFPATPVLAQVGGAGAFRRHKIPLEPSGGSLAQQIGGEWASSLAEILFNGNWSSAHRLALYALLAAEMSLFRWIALGAIVCTLASVTIAYLYPIEADTLLIVNLILLALAGMMSAYLAVQFECDEVLSFVLCNRPKKAQISVGLFTYVASPFIALTVAVAIVRIPGVVDWAGGLLAMVRALGMHP